MSVARLGTIGSRDRLLLLSSIVLALVTAAGPVHAQRQSSGAWIEIQEPAEWRGEGTRGIGVQAGRSIRVTGVANHPGGIQRVLINGARATLAPDPSGGTRFIGYVTADGSAETVEIAVYPEGDRPLVRGFGIRPAPAEKTRDKAAAWADPETAGFRGKRWAVIVGVSEYRDPRIQPLRFADADARALYDFLTSERAGLGGYDSENIRLLLNEEASYRNVRTALFDFLKGATEDDIVLIYFAGHGTPDPERLSELYLVTHDTDVEALAGTAFPMADVNAAVRRTYARDIIVITDACHSAGVAGHAGTRNVGINEINHSFLQQLQSTTGGIAVFTASEASQLSNEGEQWGGGHGVFTWSMLEALNGAADEDGDRLVTLGEMMEHVRDRVRRETRNAQIPTIGQTAFDRAWPMAIVLDPPVTAATAMPKSLQVIARSDEISEGDTLRMAAFAGSEPVFPPEFSPAAEIIPTDIAVRHLVSPSSAGLQSLLLPGLGQITTRRYGTGLLFLGGAAVAVTLGYGIHQVTTECLSQLVEGECPPDAVGNERIDRPFLVHGLAGAAGVALVAALEAYLGARRINARFLENGRQGAGGIGLGPRLTSGSSGAKVELLRVEF